MTPGVLLTKVTIWVALIAYALGAVMQLYARRRADLLYEARWIWTVGCIFYLAHVASAFGAYHNWSHTAAYEATALQTREMTGLRWGRGIYFNYVFSFLWLVDVAWWWLSPQSHRLRPHGVSALWHGFFLFMVINGAIVFGRGPAVRGLGIGICIVLLGAWFLSRRREGASTNP
jgi:hypothetical protein